MNRRDFLFGAAAAAATAAVAAPMVAVTEVPPQVCSVTVTEIDYGLPLMCTAGLEEDWAIPSTGWVEFHKAETIFSLRLPEFGDI